MHPSFDRLRPRVVLFALVLGACGDEDEGGQRQASARSPEETASACEGAEQCFEGIEIEGEAVCLERVRGGHCTHTCTSDDECCAASGECDTALTQVCSPFESTGQMMCFLSCEREAVAGSDFDEDGEYCQRLVGPDFICRSSGGGSANRKICVPGDCGVGASCGSDEDCSGDLECVTEVAGGYCGARDCAGSDDCPGDSACVRRGAFTFCARSCATESDCSFCRYGPEYACSDDVEFVGEGSGARCLPR